MVRGEINLLDKGGQTMNLAFLIGFMTFHFYLNLAFHANISAIKILIVLYFNFLGPTLILSWLKTLHGYPNAIYENLGTSVHADLMA